MFGGGTFWLFIISLALVGALALVEIIRKKNSQAAEAVEKLSSFSGWIGLALVIFCIINLLDVLRYLDMILKVVPVSTIVVLAALASGAILGLLQMLDILKQFGIIKDEQAKSISSKLAGVKIPFGFIALLSAGYLALWSIVKWGF